MEQQVIWGLGPSPPRLGYASLQTNKNLFRLSKLSVKIVSPLDGSGTNSESVKGANIVVRVSFCFTKLKMAEVRDAMTPWGSRFNFVKFYSAAFLKINLNAIICIKFPWNAVIMYIVCACENTEIILSFSPLLHRLSTQHEELSKRSYDQPWMSVWSHGYSHQWRYILGRGT